ncbi:glutathione S-transferase family protein [Roseibaca sp. V10]|uniref:Glutathione S-transferase family protein n=1 Tax=Roseinatronobacter domitianus TaxID=2940293 RepID=A0ABT0M387_9RHOB|nr:glutathione S-transferase family protein [Roseibaca domitiana]MCL1629316.1 glutathione S-transferase family protein [Roseibaca domitiana]
MILYNMPSSGNSYKVRLLLGLTGQSADCVDVEYGDVALEKAKAALPFGKAPVLVLDDGTALPESNAILWYLAQETAYWPTTPLEQAQTLSWMFWEQNQHEGVIAVRAALRTYPHRAAQATPERLEELLRQGNALLQVMEKHLANRDWLVGSGPSIADICLYAYTHSAGTRGGYDLAPFPALRAWLDRVAALPGYVGLTA